MDKNLDIITYAVSLIVIAAIMAARFSGRVRKRSLRSLAAVDADTKDKEILLLRDKVYQLEMQVSIFQKQLTKKGRSPRYTLRERLLILWHIEAFQIPRRRVTEHFRVARSTLYRWLHKIEDQKVSNSPANNTPVQIASLICEITKSNITGRQNTSSRIEPASL